jgi:hypothetical protein
MSADELRAKIAKDHERLRELEQRIASGQPSQRRQYDAMIAKARAEITQMQITLAGMSSLCPACQAAIPHHFTICLVCLREVPFKLWASYKGATCMHHAGHTHEDTVTQAKAAVLAHLKQFGTALAA